MDAQKQAPNGHASDASTSSKSILFKLESPSDPNCEPQVYEWPLKVKANGFDPALELINTIDLLSKEQDLNCFFDDKFESARQNLDRSDCKTMRTYVNEYNDAVMRFRESRHNAVYEREQVSTELLQHMMSMNYHRSVLDPAKLNQYKAHTEEVYGEFSSSMISEIVRTVPVKATDRFIDLGSGVGQVVLQVAAEGMCIDSFGVEKQDNPAEYAEAMGTNFEKILKWFGKKHGNFELKHGDFLEEQFRDRIAQADVLVVNNYKFGTKLNQQLKDRFSELREGTRIVSSLEFSPLNFTISERTLGDIGCILSVKKMTTTPDGVSWTAAPFSYYVHTVDHSMIQEYFNLNGKVPIRASLFIEEESEAEMEPEVEVTTEKKHAPPSKKKAPSSLLPAQPLSIVFENQENNASDLDRVIQPTIHFAIPELEVKAAAAEDKVEDLRAEIDALKAVNSQMRTELMKDITTKTAEVGGRLPGNVNLKGKSKYEQQVHIATDVVVNHEIWLRARCKFEAELHRTEQRAEQLAKVQERVVPRALQLAKLVDFLKLSSKWDWNASLTAPSVTSVQTVRNLLKEGAGSAADEQEPSTTSNNVHNTNGTSEAETVKESNEAEVQKQKLSQERIERAKILLRNLKRGSVESSTNGKQPESRSSREHRPALGDVCPSESELVANWVKTYFSRTRSRNSGARRQSSGNSHAVQSLHAPVKSHVPGHPQSTGIPHDSDSRVRYHQARRPDIWHQQQQMSLNGRADEGQRLHRDFHNGTPPQKRSKTDHSRVSRDWKHSVPS